MADSLALVAVSDDRRYAVFASPDKLVRVDAEKLSAETFKDSDRSAALSVSESWSDQQGVEPRVREVAEAALTWLDPVVADKPRTLRVPNSVVAALSTAPVMSTTVRDLRSRLKTGSVTAADVEKLATYIVESKSKLVYDALGGDAARRWLHRAARNDSVRSMVASIDEMAASDTEWIDPDKPHEFVVFDDNPEICGACGKPEEDEIHVAIEDTGDAKSDVLSTLVTEEITDAYIDSAHPFEPDPDAPELCYVCGKLEEDEIHTEPGDEPVTAAGAPEGFDYSESNSYFGLGEDPDSTNVSRLVMYDGSSWFEWAEGDWVGIDEAAVVGSPQKIELDQESAETLANHLVDVPGQMLELSNLDPIERNLFATAWTSLDWKLIDRAWMAGIVAAGGDPTPGIYTPQERSQNAERQARASDGRFGGGAGAGPQTDKMAGGGFARARLPQPLPLVADVNALIDGYLQRVEEERQLPADEAKEFAEASPDSSDVRPLYLAIVDSVDTEAVLDVVALVPPAQGTQADVSCFKRSGGQWVAAPELLADLRGATPPPVVELTDDELVKNVLSQVDQTDASKTDSPDEAPVEAAEPIRASGGYELWGPFGEIIPIWNPVGDRPVTAAGVPGVADTPTDHASVERLKQYWLRGEGAAKIRWGTDGDWTRCHRQLSKYLGPERSKGYCSILHRRATGMWPGDRRNQD